MAGKKKTGQRASDEMADQDYDAVKDRDSNNHSDDDDNWEGEEGYDEDEDDSYGPTKWTKNEFRLLMERCQKYQQKSERFKQHCE
jgi:hypothetical protein